MRTPVSPLSWWKRTVLRETAEYSLTGTLISPKEIAPLQIDRGIGVLNYPGALGGNERTADCGRFRAVAGIPDPRRSRPRAPRRGRPGPALDPRRAPWGAAPRGRRRTRPSGR